MSSRTLETVLSSVVVGSCFAGFYDIGHTIKYYLKVHYNLAADIPTTAKMSEDARNLMFQSYFRSFFIFAALTGAFMLLGVLILRALNSRGGLFCTGMLLRAMAAATLVISGQHIIFCKILIVAGDILICLLPAAIVFYIIDEIQNQNISKKA